MKFIQRNGKIVIDQHFYQYKNPFIFRLDMELKAVKKMTRGAVF